MRVEQRIGRLDRMGQRYEVKVSKNFYKGYREGIYCL
jgi:ribosome maturation protein Sdo1